MTDEAIIEEGYRPGVIGRVIELHGRYYGREWGLEQRFEIEVARELAAFFERYDSGRDGFWTASQGDTVLGTITIDGLPTGEAGARLRWFILDPASHGQGLGRRLLATALESFRQRGVERVWLATFAGLDAARALYEQAGFTLVREYRDTDWNEDGVMHQIFDWRP
ncbi:MAG: GNAT family N-acetyltransferase [Alphaproteobacteria bacterium]